MESESELAYHETGHAVVAYDLRIPFTRVVIDPQRGDGSTDAVPSMGALDAVTGAGEREYEDAIRLFLAGDVALAILKGVERASPDWKSGEEDRKKAARIAMRLVQARRRDEGAEACLKRLGEDVRVILMRHWLEVVAIASALMQRNSLKWEEVRDLIQSVQKSN